MSSLFQECEISDEEKSFFIDLKPFMNPTPYTVPMVNKVTYYIIYNFFLLPIAPVCVR